MALERKDTGMKRCYIAGPMTGIPDYNYPAFMAESDRLSRLGFRVENPATNPEQSDWAGYLRVALTQMLTCDLVVLLPAWQTSRGAQLEVHVAKAIGMPVLLAEDVTPQRLETMALLRASGARGGISSKAGSSDGYAHG